GWGPARCCEAAAGPAVAPPRAGGAGGGGDKGNRGGGGGRLLWSVRSPPPPPIGGPPPPCCAQGRIPTETSLARDALDLGAQHRQLVLEPLEAAGEGGDAIDHGLALRR